MLNSDTSPRSTRPRVFVGEYLCGGGMLDTPLDAIPPSLLREGTAMWRAIVDDVAQWAIVQTPVDPRLSLPESSLQPSDQTAVQTVVMQPCAEPWVGWIDAARDCEFALVVIPESDDLSTKGISLMRAAGIHVLAPTGGAIGLTVDKWSTAKWLHQHDIAHPDTWSLEPHRRGTAGRHYVHSRPHAAGLLDTPVPGSDVPGFLVKPRDGCGAMGIRWFNELDAALASMGQHEITQQYFHGRSASVSVVANGENGRVCMLPAVWQNIEEVPHTASPESHFVYLGGSGPLPSELQLRAQALTSRILQALPGKICGFVGIDMILGNDANHDCVIEVNPRLTTSYIGQRQMTDENLTQRLVTEQDHPPAFTVSPESVHWDLQN
ncbi:ATP-grasp domain-containing protein [Allorhodopirellula solitaria]|uniref:Carbamoyl phosphate synthase-like protein n=1 Tax=Allorhodopirellula solitaria TaxID=2527987 RepID=A0A5C5X2F1_9BACT|nr:ATP-grasp domain-containing protein [Allorhodopirellula solitaria]TWT56345.1 carbamoyl phosphate synthase-like protein [Allorhodopirellula solitaria]